MIDEVCPAPAGLIDRDRYRKLVRERVFPFVRDFSTWWIVDCRRRRARATGDRRARSGAEGQAVHVSGSDGTQAAADASSAAVPLRDDDGTRWLSGQKLHRLLAGGWNVSGPPAPRVEKAGSGGRPKVALLSA